MRGLRGKLAVLTGAAGGIGAAIAERLAKEGMRLCIVDVRPDALDSIAEALGDALVEARVLDVSNAEAWQALAADLASQHGGADLLINNAGITIHGAFGDQSYADLERIVDVNLRGVLFGCRALLPQLRDRAEAHIVNVASLAGRVVFPYQSTYCATKYAVRGLSAALRIELSADDIGVTTLMPGAVATALLERATSYDQEASRMMAKLMLTHGVSPERVAKRMVRAIRRNEAEVLVGLDARLMTAATTLAPTLVRTGFTSAFRRRIRRG